MGVDVLGQNKDSKACGDMAVAVVELDVPMVTLVKDGHCGDGRSPFELNSVTETQILVAEQAESDFLDFFCCCYIVPDSDH